jgi:hypothetical protein
MQKLYAGDSGPISGCCTIEEEEKLEEEEEEEEEEKLNTSAIIYIKFVFLSPLFI